MRALRKAQEAVSCPSCAVEVFAVLSAPEFAFASQTTGIGPQNTGVSGLDHVVDRAIGRDAELQWSAVAARHDRKLKVLAENPENEGKDLSRTFDDDYRVMTPDQRKAAETARGLHHEAQKQISAHAKGKEWLASRVT